VSLGFVTETTAEVESYSQTTFWKLAAAHGVCMRMIQLTQHKNLDISQRSLSGGSRSCWPMDTRRRESGRVRSFWRWFATAQWRCWTSW
jgi:hypothetical protein